MNSEYLRLFAPFLRWWPDVSRESFRAGRIARVAGLGMLGVFLGMVSGNLVALPLSWLWGNRHLRTVGYASVSDEGAARPGETGGAGDRATR